MDPNMQDHQHHIQKLPTVRPSQDLSLFQHLCKRSLCKRSQPNPWLWLAGIILHTFFMLSPLTAGSTTERQPRIFLEYSTRGTPLNPTACRMWINDQLVREPLKILPGEISHRPNEPMELGEHRVKVLLEDRNGEQSISSWSFTVRESAEDWTWNVNWHQSNPKNGSVITRPIIELQCDIRSPKSSDLDISLWHSQNNRSYQQWPQAAQHHLANISYTLKGLDDGAHSFELRLKHRSSGKEKRLATAFVLDRQAPRLENIQWSPRLYRGEGDLKLSLDIVDPPWNVAKEVSLWIENDDGQRAEVSVKNASSPLQLIIPAEQLQAWPEGSWLIQSQVKDYAGHMGKAQIPHFLQTLSEGQSLGESIQLEPLPKITSQLKVDIKGTRLLHHHIALFVNEKQVGLQRAEDSEHLSANFSFKNVSLKAGLNSLAFELYNSDGLLIGERHIATPILVDRAAPQISELSPSAEAKLTDPKPLIRFKWTDHADAYADRPGIGINEHRVLCRLNGQNLELRRKGDFWEAQPNTELPVGLHQLDIVAEDRFQWSRQHLSTFYISSGTATSMEISSDREELYNSVGESTQIKVKLSDAHGRPVKDGTVVHFLSNQGLLNRQVTTENGVATNTYYPGTDIGPRRITASLPNSKIFQTLKLKVSPSPQVMPFDVQLKLSQNAMLADRGQSKIFVTAKFKDEYGKAIPDGLEFRLQAKGCLVSPSHTKSQRGQIRFELQSGDDVGQAEIDIEHRQFHHSFTVSVEKPKPGAADSIQAEIWPPQAKAGSKLPLRVTASLQDRYGQNVPDGTLVKFKLDKGWVKNYLRTKNGRVINNIVAPDKAGLMVLKISSGSSERAFEIPVLGNEPSSDLVQSIQLASPKRFQDAKDLVLSGKLLNATGSQSSKDLILWIEHEGQRHRHLARAGVFSWKPKHSLSEGEHLFGLECEGASLSVRLHVEATAETTTAPSSSEQQEAFSILDIDFQLAEKKGQLRSGYLVVRELDRQGQPVSRERTAIVKLESDAGLLVPKTYLIAGQARVPFQYEASDKRFSVQAEIDPQRQTALTFEAEVLPTLEFRSPELANPEPKTPLADSPSKDDTPEPENQDLPNEQTTYTIDRGLELIPLSGRTELEAGGHDRTRMRFRLIDRHGLPLPDDTKVELHFPQGKLLPHRVKVKRGTIRFQLKTTDWVGSYPLVIKVGQVEKSIPIRIRAPRGGDEFLPELPDAAGQRRKWRQRR